jgi:hypothetical protein
MGENLEQIGTDFVAKVVEEVAPALGQAVALTLTAGALNVVRKYCTSEERTERLASATAEQLNRQGAQREQDTSGSTPIHGAILEDAINEEEEYEEEEDLESGKRRKK